jgi:hypothetical protein
MTLAEYRKSCWPKYNPYYGVDADGVTAELRHLDYLNCVWGNGPYEVHARYFRKRLRNQFPGVPLGQLNLKAIFV